MRHIYAYILLLSVHNLMTNCVILPGVSKLNHDLLSDQEKQKIQAQKLSNITKILNDLVDPKGSGKYDKRLRPNYGGQPVVINITIHVSSISAVSEVNMDYTIDIYLRQAWEDPRLSFEGADEDLTIGVQYQKSIWVPDTFFPNEKKSFFHDATTHNSFLRITPKGSVLTSQRLTVTATCPMELHLFPLDSQTCALEIESYGYSTRDIKYRWAKGKQSVTKSEFKLPQFKLTGFNITNVTASLTTGNYSRLGCVFRFSRSLGFYLIQIYLPSQLIVIISWVSFWLSRDATPARVSLGVTTVLTMTTLMTTTNSAMPKVSYIKSIDVYLITCFFMVFASLLEYAAVGYLNKKLRMRKETKLRAGAGGGRTGVAPMVSNGSPNMSSDISPSQAFSIGSMNYKPLFGEAGQSSGQSSAHRPPTAASSMVQANKMDYRTMKKKPFPSQGVNLPECDCEMMHAAPAVGPKLRIGPHKPASKKFSCNPSAIDKYSRLLFPVFFGVFNAIYWSAYTFISYQTSGDDEAFGD